MKIRAKISFMALVKRITIIELFSITIMKVYAAMQEAGVYPPMSTKEKERNNRLIKTLTTSNTMQGFMRSLIIYNYEKLIPGEDEVLIDYAQEEIGKKDVMMSEKTMQSVKVVKNGKTFELEIDETNNLNNMLDIGLMKD
jgi:hypothetical protein